MAAFSGIEQGVFGYTVKVVATNPGVASGERVSICRSCGGSVGWRPAAVVQELRTTLLYLASAPPIPLPLLRSSNTPPPSPGLPPVPAPPPHSPPPRLSSPSPPSYMSTRPQWIPPLHPFPRLLLSSRPSPLPPHRPPSTSPCSLTLSRPSPFDSPVPPFPICSYPVLPPSPFSLPQAPRFPSSFPLPLPPPPLLLPDCATHHIHTLATQEGRRRQILTFDSTCEIKMVGTRVYVGGLSYRVGERDLDRFFRAPRRKSNCREGTCCSTYEVAKSTSTKRVPFKGWAEIWHAGSHRLPPHCGEPLKQSVLAGKSLSLSDQCLRDR
ncbi:hypothetical protein C7M84_009697 [Penaeus vannamei]|uniref:RRM domain-containing protein n=1 Tax=Penaeus vannamei TaxID=6689 RepID=A0A3R7M4T1_PENVA|nr:hypothetical protein C7M84_009697 [Penaeus vannamei]